MEKYCSIEVCKLNVSPNEYLGKIYILVNGIRGVRNRLIVVKRPVNSIGFDARVKRIYLEYLRRGYEIDFNFQSYYYPDKDLDFSLISGEQTDAQILRKLKTKASHYRR